MSELCARAPRVHLPRSNQGPADLGFFGAGADVKVSRLVHFSIQSGSTVIYSSNFPQAMTQHVIQNFHKVYPGVSLQQNHFIALSQLLLESFKQECQGSHVGSPWVVNEQINRTNTDDTTASLGAYASGSDDGIFRMHHYRPSVRD